MYNITSLSVFSLVIFFFVYLAKGFHYQLIKDVVILVLFDDKDRFLRGGFDDYLSKPVERQLLLKTIGQYLAWFLFFFNFSVISKLQDWTFGEFDDHVNDMSDTRI